MTASEGDELRAERDQLREELRKCEVKCDGLREGLVAVESEAAVMREALLRFTPERMQSATTDYINYQDWRARTAALATNSGKSLLDELTALRARWCDAHSTNDTKPGPCPACENDRLAAIVEAHTDVCTACDGAGGGLYEYVEGVAVARTNCYLCVRGRIPRNAERLAAAEVLCKYARPHCEGCGAVNVKLYESFDGRKYRCRCGFDEARAAYKAAKAKP